jgi:hypothetical protein
MREILFIIKSILITDDCVIHTKCGAIYAIISSEKLNHFV